MGNFIVYYLKILLYTIGALIVCGFLTYLINYAYTFFVFNSTGKWLIKVSSLIGTPIHEFGHIIMCVIFRHKINEVSFNCFDDDNTLGYVRHSYNTKSFYQQLGNFFIGLGPIFSGFMFIAIILYLCFKNPTLEFYNMCMSKIYAGDNIIDILISCISLLPSLIKCDASIFTKIIAGIVILSISLHINLSPSDISSSMLGLGYYCIASFIFALITFFIGSISNNIILALSYFFLVSCVMFFIIIMFALINLIISLTIFLIVKFFEK